MAQSYHQRSNSEPHSYNIQAKLQNGILSIFVHDTMSNDQWRQEFTQISFPGHRLYDVAKSLIMAIQEMLNNANNNTNIANPLNRPIGILVYNQWCYLTIHNSKLPSFALRPVSNHNNRSQAASQSQSQSPYGFNTNKSNKNIKYGDSQRDKRIKNNVKFTNCNPIQPPTVINKAIIARNINTNNTKNRLYTNTNNKVPSSAPPQSKRNSLTLKPDSPPKTNKNRNKNKNKNGTGGRGVPPPPPTKKNNLFVPTVNYNKRESPSLPQPPTNKKNGHSRVQTLPPSRRPLPSIISPNRPLPALPVAKKMQIKEYQSSNNGGGGAADGHSNVRRHAPSRSVKFGSNLTPTMESRESLSAKNNIKFHEMMLELAPTTSGATLSPASSFHHGRHSTTTSIKIPAPPMLRKPIPSHHNKSQSQYHIDQPRQPLFRQQDPLNRSNSGTTTSSSTMSGISHIDSIGGLSHDLSSSDSSSNRSSDFEEDDSLIIDNTDSIFGTDTPSRVGSMDSNVGSLDSLFVNGCGGGNDDINDINHDMNDINMLHHQHSNTNSFGDINNEFNNEKLNLTIIKLLVGLNN
eukprot:524855_1